jgi:hypothetical protein
VLRNIWEPPKPGEVPWSNSQQQGPLNGLMAPGYTAPTKRWRHKSGNIQDEDTLGILLAEVPGETADERNRRWREAAAKFGYTPMY